MANGTDLHALRKALRARLASDQDIVLTAADLRLLLDELGRLQQSNDRLRRQNRRVRVKLQRAGIADDEPEGDVQGEP
ncbi:MAG: hypothetical protein JNL08_12450 [Planctomycetes bacterium]|nr:hypothetical protein [Planctomycetota bacterium]